MAGMSKVTRLDYCQFLLVTQINYTLTYMGEHSEQFSHDAATRYLAGEKVTARLVWEQVRDQVVPSPHGYLVFDDTVLDKNYSHRIELVRRQYSGNAHGVIKGIGVVTCVYVNPETDQFWIIDYRIDDPDRDGKTKLDHVRAMLLHTIGDKHLPWRGVLMDSWYAERKLLLLIERLGKVYYCPLKSNRQVAVGAEEPGYQRVDTWEWQATAQTQGQMVHLKGFPKDHQVRLFRLVLSTERTDYIATNDWAQHDTAATQEVGGLRWHVEQFHREGKQVTGIEQCQCRKQRSQRNHIGCAILVWIRLKQVAAATARTIYAVKHSLLDDYMRQQLRTPTIKMTFA